MNTNDSSGDGLFVVENAKQIIEITELFAIENPLKLFEYTIGEETTLYICISCNPWHIVAIVWPSIE